MRIVQRKRGKSQEGSAFVSPTERGGKVQNCMSLLYSFRLGGNTVLPKKGRD